MVASADLASTRIWLIGPKPVKAFCTVGSGATTVSSGSWKPVPPLVSSTPTTVNGVPPRTIFLPTGLTAPNRSVAVVEPITATFRELSTSSALK